MTTIQAAFKPTAVPTPAVSLGPPTTTSTSFSQSLSAVQTPKSWVTTAEASRVSRPNITTFMERTGAAFNDAAGVIFGVVGSNTDVRDWSAIMSSEDPMTSVRQATAQMYGRTDISPRTDAFYMDNSNTLARDGNFAILQLKDEQGKVTDQGLKLIDAQGLVLRDAGGSAKRIARNAWLFGFDTQPIAKLAKSASSVSENLGKAMTQASQMIMSNAAMVTTRSSAIKPSLTFNSTASVIAMSQSSNRSQFRAEEMRANDRGSALAPEQATSRASRTHVDSASYLRSFFRA